MDSNESSHLLRYAAKKVAQNRFFLAEYLNEFSIIRGITEDELVQFLGCSSGLLPKLALCRRPDPDSPRFRSDVERIAAAFDIQPERLVRLIREVDTLKALANARTKRQEVPDGLLAVARDDEDSDSGHRDTNESYEDVEGKP
jgi:hypothetical protein